MSRKLSLEEKRDAQLADDWQTIAHTAAGQRIISDIMTWGNVYSPIDENDPVALGRATGENNFAKRIARLLKYRPEHYSEKAEEHLDIIDGMLRSQSHVPGMH